jgi:hypothetical protein
VGGVCRLDSYMCVDSFMRPSVDKSVSRGSLMQRYDIIKENIEIEFCGRAVV